MMIGKIQNGIISPHNKVSFKQVYIKQDDTDTMDNLQNILLVYEESKDIPGQTILETFRSSLINLNQINLKRPDKDFTFEIAYKPDDSYTDERRTGITYDFYDFILRDAETNREVGKEELELTDEAAPKKRLIGGNGKHQRFIDDEKENISGAFSTLEISLGNYLNALPKQPSYSLSPIQKWLLGLIK